MRSIGPCLLLLAVGAGCHRASTPSAQAKADLRAELESQREQLEMIPPPAKSRYMAVHTFESWQNPYLTVNAGMLELHITMADANTSSLGVGGIMRPVAARQQDMDIGLDKLGEAMSSIPETAWPYGRVVGIGEARKIPPSAEPTVRRNMETAIARLTDLGVVVYDVSDGKVQ